MVEIAPTRGTQLSIPRISDWVTSFTTESKIYDDSVVNPHQATLILEIAFRLTNLHSEAAKYVEGGSKATNLFYALILLISQNQAANLNDDPEQKIFISQGGMTLGSGARSGQIRRVININLFSDANIQDLPDIDSFGGSESEVEVE